MKKILAVLLAVICAFSVCCVAFAEEEETVTAGSGAAASLTCDFCSESFEDAAALKAHIESTFPNANHEKVCGNTIIVDGVVTECTEVFHSKAALASHQETCKSAGNADLMKAYFKAGDILNGLKYLVKVIIDFVKSDTFKKIVDVVKGIVGKIDLGGIVNTVKDVAGKIPLDKIKDVIGGLVG